MQSRRDMLQASVGLVGVAALGGASPASATPGPVNATSSGLNEPASPLQKQLREDMETYAAFGSKLSGSPGDLAAARWIGERLGTAGFAVNQVDFPIPVFEPGVSELRFGSKHVPVAAQPVVITTPPAGLTALLFWSVTPLRPAP